MSYIIECHQFLKKKKNTNYRVNLKFLCLYAREYIVFWRNLYRRQKIYTIAGSDGSDKPHLWIVAL